MEVTTPTPAPAPNAEPAPSPAAEVKADAKAEARKLKVKLDGEEREIDEQEAVRDYERRQVSHKRFEEAAKIRKEAEEILSMPKKDLNKFLRDQGVTLDALTDILAKRIEEESLTPEEIDQRKKEEKLKKYEDQDREAEEKKAAEAEAARVEDAKKVFDSKIFDALKDSGLTKDPYAVRSAALFIKSCLKNGFEPDADEIRDAVEGRVRNDYKSQVTSRKGKELIQWLGDDVVNEIRRYDLEQLRSSRQSKQPEIPKAPAPEPKKPQKFDKWELQKRVDEWAKS
jgi:hypothetical protein